MVYGSIPAYLSSYQQERRRRMKELQGRVVLVTGVYHGIGWAIWEACRDQGALVYGSDLRGELRQRSPSLWEAGYLRQMDVTKSEDWAAWVAEVYEREGRIDGLVNCAGGVVGQVHQPIEDVSDQDWHAVVEVNLTGSFYGIRAVAPFMKRQGAGSIVNISSGAGRSVSLTGIQAYASAKAGQLGLTRQMAHELGPYGIRVNAICPGFVRSNPSSERQWQAMGEEGQQDLLRRIPLRRLGTPEDMADVTVMLLGDRCRYMTGQVISVDGGLLLF
jgi:3-oxoacyl-[acyl-carrier protein] reductase